MFLFQGRTAFLQIIADSFLILAFLQERESFDEFFLVGNSFAELFQFRPCPAVNVFRSLLDLPVIRVIGKTLQRTEKILFPHMVIQINECRSIRLGEKVPFQDLFVVQQIGGETEIKQRRQISGGRIGIQQIRAVTGNFVSF